MGNRTRKINERSEHNFFLTACFPLPAEILDVGTRGRNAAFFSSFEIRIVRCHRFLALLQEFSSFFRPRPVWNAPHSLETANERFVNEHP